MNIIMHHIAIQTQNFDKSYEFYTDFIGFEVSKEPYQFKSRKLCFLKCANVQIELFTNKSEGDLPDLYNPNRDGLVHFALEVENFDTLYEKFLISKFKILKVPYYPPTNDNNKVKIFKVEGPDGQEIEFREVEKKNNVL